MKRFYCFKGGYYNYYSITIRCTNGQAAYGPCKCILCFLDKNNSVYLVTRVFILYFCTIIKRHKSFTLTLETPSIALLSENFIFTLLVNTFK